MKKRSKKPVKKADKKPDKKTARKATTATTAARPADTPRMPGEQRFWLVKSEPETFSFDDLLRIHNKTTNWNGIRNFVARGYLRDGLKTGDRVFFYHSGAAQAMDIPTTRRSTLRTAATTRTATRRSRAGSRWICARWRSSRAR
jgi:hypothetical protein